MYNTTNPGMDMPLSSGQRSVHSGHTYVQTQGKYFRFSRKKNCQKLKNGQKVDAVKYLLKIKTPSCIEFRKGKSLDIKVSNLDRRMSMLDRRMSMLDRRVSNLHCSVLKVILFLQKGICFINQILHKQFFIKTVFIRNTLPIVVEAGSDIWVCF